ncbi:MAG: MotE family protein [Rhizobiaceae bacterium]|nr:MotE family protein [Rhizobiaceae bacterium]
MMITKHMNLGLKLALATSAVWLTLSMPASTESADGGHASAPAKMASATVDGDEIQRFCGNIADAARDRRYALQAEELQKLQAEIDERIKALDEKRAEYEKWMRKREEFLSQAQDGVVKIFSAMKPDIAAEQLAELKPNLAAGILMKIAPRKASVILNEMKSTEAAVLTTIMASAVRREDPS